MTNLRAGDHADGSNISIGDTEEHHDDDVGGVTLKHIRKAHLNSQSRSQSLRSQQSYFLGLIADIQVHMTYI